MSVPVRNGRASVFKPNSLKVCPERERERKSKKMRDDDNNGDEAPEVFETKVVPRLTSVVDSDSRFAW